MLCAGIYHCLPISQWRLGSDKIARIHLGGIEKILHTSTPKGAHLSASTRRGIFWQDLNTAIVTNTPRVLSRATFPEFQWGTTFNVPWKILPAGFEYMRDLLGGPAIEILQDLYVLQRSSDGVGSDPNDINAIHHMDNQQACVEARLQENIQDMATSDGVVASILLAGYLFAYSLFTSVWNGYAVPQSLSSRLLGYLQLLTVDDSWRLHEHVLLWCTIIGGSLSPLGITKDQFVRLLEDQFRGSIVSATDSWPMIEPYLDNFLWSRQRFRKHGKAFWEAREVLL
jgi:hypothetical protein